MKKHSLIFGFLLMLSLFFIGCGNPAQQTSTYSSEDSSEEETTPDYFAEDMPVIQIDSSILSEEVEDFFKEEGHDEGDEENDGF